MIWGLISLNENWGAKLEIKYLKTNKEVKGRKDVSCYLINVTVPIVLYSPFPISDPSQMVPSINMAWIIQA